MRSAGSFRLLAAVLALAAAGPVLGQAESKPEPERRAESRNLAPGFNALPVGARVVIMPTDIELFSMSAGGVLEPKADWTESASKHFKQALVQKKGKLGLPTVELTGKQADEADEINALHGAVARAISMHHFGPLKLPTKEGKLDWSMGEPVRLVKEMTGADYALFSWVRDSYASAERKAAMVAIAVLSMGRAVASGGMQTGYASLVDLNTGRVIWFNQLIRPEGDLREADKAAETVDALLSNFPVSK